MAYTRAQLNLDTSRSVNEFVQEINSDGTTNKYTFEDFDGTHRVNARSFLGALYASCEFGGKIFLVNETEDGYFPSFVDKYRA